MQQEKLSCCFHISKQGAQIIPPAIQDAIHIDRISIRPVKGQIISAHQEAVIALHICHRGKGRTRESVCPQDTQGFYDSVDSGKGRVRVFYVGRKK